jgi:hypothetical protein
MQPAWAVDCCFGMKARPRPADVPVDYRLPRETPWGLIALAAVTIAAAVPFVGFVLLVAIS